MTMLSVVVGERAAVASMAHKSTSVLQCCCLAQLGFESLSCCRLETCTSRTNAKKCACGRNAALRCFLRSAQLHAKLVFSSSNQETHYIALADASDECNTSIKRRSTGSNMLLVRGRAK